MTGIGKPTGHPGALNPCDFRPDATEAVYAELTGKFEAEITTFDDLVKTEVVAINASLANTKLGDIVVR